MPTACALQKYYVMSHGQYMFSHQRSGRDPYVANTVHAQCNLPVCLLLPSAGAAVSHELVTEHITFSSGNSMKDLLGLQTAFAEQ
jgi:hypothetical protein